MSGVGGGSGPIETMFQMLRLFEDKEQYSATLQHYDAKVAEATAAEAKLHDSMTQNTKLLQQAQALADKTAAKEELLKETETRLNQQRDELNARIAQHDRERAALEADKADSQQQHEKLVVELSARVNEMAKAKNELDRRIASAAALEEKWLKKLAAAQKIIEDDD